MVARRTVVTPAPRADFVAAVSNSVGLFSTGDKILARGGRGPGLPEIDPYLVSLSSVH